MSRPTWPAASGSGSQLEATVDRREFGLNWNAPLPKGGFALGNDVTLVVALELMKAGGVMKVLGISGSLRQGSYNSRLLRAAGELLPPGAELEEFTAPARDPRRSTRTQSTLPRRPSSR